MKITVDSETLILKIILGLEKCPDTNVIDVSPKENKLTLIGPYEKIEIDYTGTNRIIEVTLKNGQSKIWDGQISFEEIKNFINLH